ncbi:MAG: hypothetical protein RLZZ584_1848 [Pseudomonadota bacterium]
MIRLPLSTARLSTLAAATAVLALGALPAQAGEVYLQGGLPGFGIGYAQPLNSNFGLRADWVTLGTRRKTQNEEGIDYSAKLNSSRLALLGDVYPFAGRFRLTAGLTSNNYKLELDAAGAGRTINVGGRNYTLNAGDGYNVQIKFPGSTPYLGFGWGHQADTGFRFASDVGLLFGKARLTATGRGQLATAQAQADIDREVAKLSDGVGKIRYVPQFSFSLGYGF